MPGLGSLLPSGSHKRNISKRNISAPTPITLPPTVTSPSSPLIDLHNTPSTTDLPGTNHHEKDDDAKSISRGARKWMKHAMAPIARTASNATQHFRKRSNSRNDTQSIMNISSPNLLMNPELPGTRPNTVFSFRGGDTWVGRRRRTDSCIVAPAAAKAWDVMEFGKLEAERWTHRDIGGMFIPEGKIEALERLAGQKGLFARILKNLSPKDMAKLSQCSKSLYIATAPTLYCSVTLMPAPMTEDSTQNDYLENTRFEVLQSKLKSLTRVSDKTMATYVKEVRVVGNWIILTEDYSDDEGTASLVSSNKSKSVEEAVAELLTFNLKRSIGMVSFVWDSVHPVFPKVMACLSSINSLRHLRLNVRTSMPLDGSPYPLQQNYLPTFYPFNQLHSLIVTNIPPKGTLLSSIFRAISVSPFLRMVCLSGVEDIRTSMASFSSTASAPIRRDVATQKNYFPTFDWEVYRSSKVYDLPNMATTSQAALTINTSKKNPYKALLPITYLGLKNFVLDGKILNLEIDSNTLTHLSLINCYGDGFYLSEEVAQNLKCITTDCFVPHVIQVLPAFLRIDGSYYVEKLMAENLDLLNAAQINPRSTSLLPSTSLKIQTRACKDASKKLSLLTNPNTATRNAKHILTDFLTTISALPDSTESIHPLTALRLPADWPLTAQDIRKLFGVNRGEAGEMVLWHLKYLSLSIQQSPHTWKNFLLFLPNFYDLVGIHVLTESEPQLPSGGGTLPSGVTRPKTIYSPFLETSSPNTHARLIELKRSSRGLRSSLRGVSSQRRYLIDDAKDILEAFLERQQNVTIKWIAVKGAVWRVQKGGGGEKVGNQGWGLRRCSWEEVREGGEGVGCHWGEEGW